MNLKDFLTSRDNPPELFWSLVLEAGWVQAGVWYIGETAAEVLSVSPATAWEGDEELISATDAALSTAIQKLPENYKEPNKTVFGVPSSWVKEGEINDEHLAIIKKLCTELSLTPVGFVVLPEAIAHLYKSEEQAPLNAVVLGLGSDSVEVSVFKLGALVGTSNVARSVSLIEDVTEGLARFEGAAPLPSRIIVYDGKGGELEEAKETLMTADWDENGKAKFLHTPKVEILSTERKVLATSLAGANEIANVSKVTSHNDEDMSQSEDVIPPEVENVKSVSENITAESLGFSVGTDVSKNFPQPSLPPQPIEPMVPKGPNFVQKTKNLLHGFSVPKFAFKTGPSKSSIYIILGSVLTILIAAALAWWFYPRAVVSIYVTPKTFEQDTELSFNTSGNFDIGAGVVPATTEVVSVSGQKTKSTSGTKLIGDRAKGNVQIANGNTDSINLAAGTILISSSNLKYVTDTAASISGQLVPGSPGTAVVSVTSGDIGAQYNLAKGEVFKVGNYLKSLVAATSTADFSGGSSQQIAAVSPDDQKNLETDLKTELSGNAMDQLVSKITNSQVFVNDLANTTVSSETFDHKVGDQADTLKLTLKMDATGVYADRVKLLQYATSLLKDKIPSGYVLRDSQISFKFTFESLNGDTIKYKVAISANFLPNVSPDAIVKQILGKTPNIVEQYLTSIPGFSRVDITLKPTLPSVLKTLPHIARNISIVVAADK